MYGMVIYGIFRDNTNSLQSNRHFGNAAHAMSVMRTIYLKAQCLQTLPATTSGFASPVVSSLCTISPVN